MQGCGKSFDEVLVMNLIEEMSFAAESLGYEVRQAYFYVVKLPATPCRLLLHCLRTGSRTPSTLLYVIVMAARPLQRLYIVRYCALFRRSQRGQRGAGCQHYHTGERRGFCSMKDIHTINEYENN